MTYCKIVRFSELGNSWLPHDHILEAQLDELLERLNKRQAVLKRLTTEVAELRADAAALTDRIKD